MTDFIIKYRWLIISICLFAGIALGALIPLSKTDPEIRNYIPPGMKSRVETDKIEKEFGVQDMVMLLFSDSTILTSENLKQIKDIDRDISKLTGVTNRISPFTVQTIKSRDDMMVADPLIKRIPANSVGMDQLKQDILKNRFARDIVVSSDMTSASITATINNSEPEKTTLHKIDSIVNAHPGNAQVLKGGLPYIRQHILKDVKKDGIILVPLALIVMLLILKSALGDWRSVAMPFSVVVLSLALSMGLIPLMGWKLSMIIILVPIILIAVANNYGIYLVARYQELSLTGGITSNEGKIRELLGSLNMPILFSGLTTIAGILGLLTHSIIPAKQVGVIAAIGVSAALFMSLFYIPALIYLRGKKLKEAKPVKVKTDGFYKFLGGLSKLIINHSGKIIVVSAIVTLVISAGIFMLKVETNQENYFPKNNPVKMASDVINKKFGGSQTISIMVSGDIKDPAVMKGIDNLTREMENTDGVGQIFSISQAVREMSKAIYTDGEIGYDNIPDSRESIAQMFELYNMSGNPEDFRQMMNLENTKAHILIRLSNPENAIIQSVKERLGVLTSAIPAEITIGGYAIIMTDFSDSIIKGQVMSLVFALITVFLLLAIIFRSAKGGLIGSIPLAVSIVILFGFMGFAGIALDAATALLSSVMIGVGVDFTIQYIWCFNIQIRKGLSYEESTRTSIATIGRSIIINATTVMAGFSPLILSGFTSIRFFGYLTLISIGSCLTGALVLVPAILMKFSPRFVEKNLNNNKFRKHEKSNHLININTAAFSGISPAAGCRPDYEQIP
ncbi:MAG: MMPL family transporter [Bacteroidia bacterium]|nr:MMPL family transporter [Bacteroidia bacterium]